MVTIRETEEMKKENTRKRLFVISVVLCFVTIFLYELFTPMLMDDMTYLSQVKKAGSIAGLLAQEKQQYLGWTGRSVAHMMLRLVMFADLHIFGGGRMTFNIISSAVFTILSLLIYKNIQKTRKYDVLAYLLILLLVWMYGVSFAQTVLWETGACNYLFTTTIIMAFITYFRSSIEKSIALDDTAKEKGVLKAVLMLIAGVLAGWCNENTSGGCLLFILILLAMYLKQGKKLKIWMITGLVGNVAGLAIMVLAPGNALRAAGREELHTGLLGMAARFLNITLAIRDEFIVLIGAFIVLVVFLRIQGRKWAELLDVLVFGFLFLATSYSLILTVTPQDRALFGGDIFLIIAIVQAFEYVAANETWIQLIKRASVYLMLLYMLFTYLDCGASLARIYREEKERYDYLEEWSKTGAEDAEAPMLRPQFENRYTAAYDCDITEDWTNWNNMMMANYYGFKTLLGVDRDEWDKY